MQASVLSSTATATATGTTRAATTNLPVAGDFEAEYRGAMEHAKETTLHAVHTAFSDHKVTMTLLSLSPPPFLLFLYVRLRCIV